MESTKRAVPAAARSFKKRVDAIVSACERGSKSRAECLDELHGLTCTEGGRLFRAFREESGEPLTRVVVETVPLDCPECGEIHTGEELEASGGECPG
jgi:hypothetical protein